MSDLISRSELLKEIEKYKFGAISNDAEREYIKKTILNFIICQPTAYDIDNVVEELETNKQNALEVEESIKEYNVWNKAIEIVKQCGVSDDVCEWKSTQINNEWKPSCEPNSTYNVFGVAWFRKCPYCGKKIKVVE